VIHPGFGSICKAARILPLASGGSAISRIRPPSLSAHALISARTADQVESERVDEMAITRIRRIGREIEVMEQRLIENSRLRPEASLN
jgi:hypothetical protein